MSETQTLLLGFIAGVTILIGLPLGRVRSVKPGTRQFLNAIAIGILIFLIWDVLVRLGPAELATVDALITAGIVNSRSEGLRRALSRLRGTWPTPG